MRRRLNNAYLVQTLLMVCLLVLLVFLALRSTAPLVFSLVFLGGIVVAALPSIYTGYVLPRREFQRAAQVRLSGRSARAQVLEDGDQILSDFRRTTMGHKGVSLLLDIPVLLDYGQESARKMSMKAEIDALQELKPGMLVGVRCDPADPQYIVLDDIMSEAP
jgi:hypothetical protein